MSWVYLSGSSGKRERLLVNEQTMLSLLGSILDFTSTLHAIGWREPLDSRVRLHCPSMEVDGKAVCVTVTMDTSPSSLGIRLEVSWTP